MEQNKRLHIVIVIVAVGLLAILLSTCLGAFAGGVVGYCAGRKAASTRITEQPFPEWRRQPILPEERRPLMPRPGGALVTEVVGDSPADQAGIQPGDLIITVDNVRVDEENTLERLIRKYQPGDRVTLALWSRGQERAVKVRLAEHPEDRRVAYLGVYYQAFPMRMEPPSPD